MRKIKNAETVIGRIYQFDLSEKTSKKGVNYISGKLDIATDDAGMNIVSINYTYVAPTFPAKDGEQPKQNKTYPVLKQIIDSAKTWVTDGPEAATCVKCDTSLSVNNFVGRDDQMVESMRNEGGFVTIITADKVPAEESKRKKFDIDAVLYGIVHVDANDENGVAEHDILKARIIDFKGMTMPVEFTVFRPDGMSYFESLEPSDSNPVFTQVRGTIDSLVMNIEKVTESAFGEPTVEIVEKRSKAWVVNAAAPVVYDLDEEGADMTYAELRAGMQAYETHLAEVKASNAEYQASKNNGFSAASSAPATAPAAKGDFKF